MDKFEEPITRPEVDLRRAIRRANVEGVPLARIIDIFDLENIR
jgi:hypothetical protein